MFRPKISIFAKAWVVSARVPFTRIPHPQNSHAVCNQQVEQRGGQCIGQQSTNSWPNLPWVHSKHVILCIKPRSSPLTFLLKHHLLQALPVCSISHDHPFIEPKDLIDAQSKLAVDCKAAMLCGRYVIKCIYVLVVYCAWLKTIS